MEQQQQQQQQQKRSSPFSSGITILDTEQPAALHLTAAGLQQHTANISATCTKPTFRHLDLGHQQQQFDCYNTKHNAPQTHFSSSTMTKWCPLAVVALLTCPAAAATTGSNPGGSWLGDTQPSSPPWRLLGHTECWRASSENDAPPAAM
jgi:hypothetical protein